MKKTALTIVLATAALAGGAQAALPVLFEEAQARTEEERIFRSPIAGIENRYWFNYRTNVLEAKKELSSDLRRASDTEDLRDAWGEYGSELRDERVDYAEEMAERGFRSGTVRFEDY